MYQGCEGSLPAAGETYVSGFGASNESQTKVPCGLWCQLLKPVEVSTPATGV